MDDEFHQDGHNGVVKRRGTDDSDSIRPTTEPAFGRKGGFENINAVQNQQGSLPPNTHANGTSKQSFENNNSSDSDNGSAKNSNFGVTIGDLNKLLNPKSLSQYEALGGLQNIAYNLRTDLNAGLSMDECELEGSFHQATAEANSGRNGAGVTRSATVATMDIKPGTFVDRKREFKDNSLPAKSAKSLWRLMWEQYSDKILILLTIAAVVSLALGLYESLGVEHPEGSPPAVDWIEGVAICVAIIIVVLVGSLNDYQKERQFVKLNAKVGLCTVLLTINLSLTVFYRKRTVRLRWCGLGARCFSTSTMCLWARSCTSNLVTCFPQMEFSSRATM